MGVSAVRLHGSEFESWLPVFPGIVYSLKSASLFTSQFLRTWKAAQNPCRHVRKQLRTCAEILEKTQNACEHASKQLRTHVDMLENS